MIDAEQSWLQAAIDNEVYNLQVSKRLQPSVGLRWRNTCPRRSDLVDCEDGTKSVRTVMKGKATIDSTRGAPSDTWSQSVTCLPVSSPSLCSLALLQLEFNREFPTIFTTYQCYLKDSLQRLETDLDRASRGG